MHLPDWLIKPETLFAIVLFVLGVLVSLFSVEIRRLLSVPPRKWRGLRVARLQYRLNLMQRLHNDAYRLLLYFMWSIGECVWQYLVSYGPVIALVGIKIPFAGKPLQALTLDKLVPPAAGVAFGWVWHLRKTVYDQYHYEERFKFYAERIAHLTGATAEVPSTPESASAPSGK